jgi:hypothetical protein
LHADARVIPCVAKLLKKTRRTIPSVGMAGAAADRCNELGTIMWGFLNSPVTWTLIILILSGLGIFRELL